METKGLCETCAHDKDCSFPRKFPVLQCEEFSVNEPEAVRMRQVKKAKQRIGGRPFGSMMYETGE